MRFHLFGNPIRSDDQGQRKDSNIDTFCVGVCQDTNIGRCKDSKSIVHRNDVEEIRNHGSSVSAYRNNIAHSRKKIFHFPDVRYLSGLSDGPLREHFLKKNEEYVKTRHSHSIMERRESHRLHSDSSGARIFQTLWIWHQDAQGGTSTSRRINSNVFNCVFRVLAAETSMPLSAAIKQF